MPRKSLLVAGFLALALAVLVEACSDSEESPAQGADAGPLGIDGSTTSGSEGGIDASASLDASSEAAPTDARADGSTDASLDGGDADADSSTGPTNFARLGTATATSTYTDYVAAHVNDGLADSSWYPATGSCEINTDGGPDYVCISAPTHVAIALDTPRTIGRVKILGNRDLYPSGYDVLTARIELLDAANAVLASAIVTTSRGAEPNGDVEHVFTPAKTGVKTVRVVVLTGEASGPGLGEVEAYAN